MVIDHWVARVNGNQVMGHGHGQHSPANLIPVVMRYRFSGTKTP